MSALREQQLIDQAFSGSPLPERAEPYFTLAEAAAYLKIGETALLRLSERGQIDIYFRRGAGWVIYDSDMEATLAASPTPEHHLTPRPGHRLAWATEERAWAEVLVADPCSYCGAPVKHLDHIEPLAGGGTHTWANLTGACQRCNVSKGARPMLVWLASKGR